jgi:hypothetical protein
MPNLYFSAAFDGGEDYGDRILARIDYRLLSLHGSYAASGKKMIDVMRDKRNPKEISLLFDSGAFTAWSKKEPDIDVRHLLKTYKEFVAHCRGDFKHLYFINLDKIPGAPGRTPDLDEIKDAIRISDENFRVLHSELGNDVLPVFHQGEEFERLREVAELNPVYICVSPRNDLMEPDRRAWSQRAHHFIANKLPTKVKTHGLAATGGEMLSNVEWYSVDSARWIHAAAYGTILVDFDGKMRIVAVSEHSTELKKSGNHADHVAAAPARKRIDKVCDEIGVTYEELREKMGARALFNVTVMSEVSKRPFVPVPVQSTLLVM